MTANTLLRRAWANPYLLLTLTMLFWSGNAVASRLAVGNISPMSLTALRWACVCALMPLFIRGTREELAGHLRTLLDQRWKMIAFGVCGFTIFNALMNIAAYSTTAINIGILQGAMPVFVLLGAFLAYRTPIGWLQGLGVLVTIIGVVVTASRGDLSVLTSFAFARGDLWMTIACVLYSGYTVGLRKRPPVPGLIFFVAMAAIACLAALPLLAFEIWTGFAFWPTAKGWLVLVFVVLGPSFVAQLSFMRAVELVGPGRAGVFVNLVPVFSPILAVLILGENLAAYHAVALAFVLGGIWIAERRRS